MFDDEDDEDIEVTLLDWDDVPDILHRWLEHESSEQQAFLVGDDYDETLDEVLDFKEAVFLILYLCSLFEIGVSLKFSNGGGVVMDHEEEEE